ncbi:MAG: ArsR/SmtB family transcription factor [Bacilli bacterium]
MNSKKISNLFKVYSDKNRIEIAQLLMKEEKCACELLNDLKISQPTLSHHMKILIDNDAVIERREKKRTYYKMNLRNISNLIELLENGFE